MITPDEAKACGKYIGAGILFMLACGYVATLFGAVWT